MDLQDFEAQALYFDQPLDREVEVMIQHASDMYPEEGCEKLLIDAFRREPEHLSVLVAMYRFYYYQHRYPEAIKIATVALNVVGEKIDFPKEWENLTFHDLGEGLLISFTMVRFYLTALKGIAYLNLRMGNVEQGVKMLNKVIELDKNDRLRAKSLLQAVGPALVKTESSTPVSASI